MHLQYFLNGIFLQINNTDISTSVLPHIPDNLLGSVVIACVLLATLSLNTYVIFQNKKDFKLRQRPWLSVHPIDDRKVIRVNENSISLIVVNEGPGPEVDEIIAKVELANNDNNHIVEENSNQFNDFFHRQ